MIKQTTFQHLATKQPPQSRKYSNWWQLLNILVYEVIIVKEIYKQEQNVLNVC